MARVRSGALGVASDSEATVVAEVGPGGASLTGRYHLRRMNSRRQCSLRIGHSSLSISGLPNAVFVGFKPSSLKRV